MGFNPRARDGRDGVVVRLASFLIDSFNPRARDGRDPNPA